MNIQQTLKYSTAKYNRLVLETYIAYCGLVAASNTDFQKIVANTAYFNWWLQEYRILEHQFLQDVQPYIDYLEVSAIRDFYDEKTTKIALRYSKTLLSKARKLEIINNPQFN